MKSATVPQRNESKDYLDIHDLRDALPQAVRAALLAAVKNVSLPHLPIVTALQRIGDGMERS